MEKWRTKEVATVCGSHVFKKWDEFNLVNLNQKYDQYVRRRSILSRKNGAYSGR